MELKIYDVIRNRSLLKAMFYRQVQEYRIPSVDLELIHHLAIAILDW